MTEERRKQIEAAPGRFQWGEPGVVAELCAEVRRLTAECEKWERQAEGLHLTGSNHARSLIAERDAAREQVGRLREWSEDAAAFIQDGRHHGPEPEYSDRLTRLMNDLCDVLGNEGNDR